MERTVRVLAPADFDDALVLYRELVGDIPVAQGLEGQSRFEQILGLEGTAIFGAEKAGRIVSMATVHVLPNMTFGGRPYSLIENVVTQKAHQGHGLGRAVMRSAIEHAWAQDAYKIMLLSGRAFDAVGFYQKLGFNSDDKHGLILRRAPQRRP
ncbi:MAG: GNAT family N-acetyltransferase [Sulfitobacter sp.]